jgi:hypothetical protein
VEFASNILSKIRTVALPTLKKLVQHNEASAKLEKQLKLKLRKCLKQQKLNLKKALSKILSNEKAKVSRNSKIEKQ